MPKKKNLTVHPMASTANIEQVPLAASSVQAGFPSPAGDYMDSALDLHQLVVKNPPATFFVRVEGESMLGARIEPGDILVVDRSLTPSSGKIVIAILNGEFTVKRIRLEGGKIFLEAENPAFSEIAISEGSDFQVWGVVTYVVHKA
jgi:DNA polymerase V